MSNSSLVSYVGISPNKNSPRNHVIDRITPHCVVGQLSAQTICDCFRSPSVKASCNYGIGYDGKVSLVVDERDRSWCSSSSANDNRAVTIECASDKTHPYAMTDAVYNSLINLCVDICRRNGKNKLLWFGDKTKTLNYEPKANEMVITVHRWFKNKECPGDWLYSRLGDLANRVNAQLGSATPVTQSESTFTPYMVKVTANALNIRKEPTTASPVVGSIRDKGTYTIVAESGTWGKLKSGAGWISLNYTKRV